MKYKHNNRSYTSEGLQVELDVNAGSHNLSLGFRVMRTIWIVFNTRCL